MLADWLLMAARQISIGTPTAGGATSSATLTIAKPDNVSAGTILLAFVQINADRPVTPPSGWTELIDSSRRSVHMIVLDGSEGSSFTWAFTGAAAVQGFIVPVAGASYDAIGAFGPTANPAVAPSATASVANSLALAWFSENNVSIAFSTPSGWTSVIADADASNCSAAIFSKAVSAGATGAASSTPTPSANCRGIQVVLKPR